MHLGLTSPHNQISLTTQKRSAKGMENQNMIGKAPSHLIALPSQRHILVAHVLLEMHP